MSAALLKGLAELVPAGLLFCGWVILFLRKKMMCSFFQLLGSGCLVVVVLTHLCEVLHVFSWMHWGLEHSAGHYLDLGSAVLGLTLFSGGYLLCSHKAAHLITRARLPFLVERLKTCHDAKRCEPRCR